MGTTAPAISGWASVSQFSGPSLGRRGTGMASVGRLSPGRRGQWFEIGKDFAEEIAVS